MAPFIEIENATSVPILVTSIKLLLLLDIYLFSGIEAFFTQRSIGKNDRVSVRFTSKPIHESILWLGGLRYPDRWAVEVVRWVERLLANDRPPFKPWLRRSASRCLARFEAF